MTAHVIPSQVSITAYKVEILSNMLTIRPVFLIISLAVTKPQGLQLHLALREGQEEELIPGPSSLVEAQGSTVKPTDPYCQAHPWVPACHGLEGTERPSPQWCQGHPWVPECHGLDKEEEPEG